MKITKTKLREIIREEILEAKYRSDVKSQKEFRKNLDTIVKKIQKHWGGKAKRLVEPSKDLYSLIPRYIQLKQKFGLDRFLTTKITFTDKSKSPIKWLEVGGYRDEDRNSPKSFDSFDIINSEGWKDNKDVMDYQIKDDRDLVKFFKFVEKEYPIK